MLYFFKKLTAIPNMASTAAAANDVIKKVIFKNCAFFTDCISETNNPQVGNAKDINVVTSM